MSIRAFCLILRSIFSSSMDCLPTWEGLNFEDSGKLDDEGRKVYNVGKYRWGFTTATQVTDYRKASSYLCKYVTKDMCAVSRGKKKYWSSRNAKLPEVQELLLEESTDERIQKFLEGHTYIKRVRTPYTDVTYIERPMWVSGRSIRQTHVFRIDQSIYASQSISKHIKNICPVQDHIPWRRWICRADAGFFRGKRAWKSRMPSQLIRPGFMQTECLYPDGTFHIENSIWQLKMPAFRKADIRIRDL